MTSSLVADSFRHHAWATARLLDVCSEVDPGILATEVAGTVGTPMATLRHLVSGDRFQLWAIGAGVRQFHSSEMGFDELRAAHAANVDAWSGFLAVHADGDELAVDVDDAGWKRTASVGLRIAQALSHAVEHRTQVCTALAMLGIDPPDLSGWQFGNETGTVTEVLSAPKES